MTDKGPDRIWAKGWGRAGHVTQGREGGAWLYLLSLLEPSGWDSVTLLMFQQLFRSLHELMADVTLEHARNQVDLQVPLIHGPRFADEVAEHTLETCVAGVWGGHRVH